MPVASCLPFPFSTSCDDMLTMFVCATCWPSMHLYTLAHMSMHESCLLVCRPYFNTMKLWTPDPNLHLSHTDTTFCLLFCLFSFLLVCLLVFFLVSCWPSCFLAFFFFVYLVALHVSCHMLCLPCLSRSSFFMSFHILFASFLPLLVCWFLVFAFACTQIERGRMELGHDLPVINKKGEDVSMWI